MKIWLASRVRLITDHYLLVLIFALVLSALGAFFIRKLSLQSDLSALIPDHYESVKTLKKVGDKIGGFETMEILVQGDNFESIKKYAAALTEKLKKSPMVSFVAFEADVDFYERHALLYINYDELVEIRDRIRDQTEKSTLEYNPFYVDLEENEEKNSRELTFDDFEEKYKVSDSQRYLINEEKSILVIKIFPQSTYRDVQFARRFYNEIRSIVAGNPPEKYDPDLFVEYGGNFKNKIDEYEIIVRDVRSTAVIGLSAVFLLILLYFRRFSVGIFIGVPLAMSLLWTFGLAYLVIGSLNTITVFLFVVLFGMGIDFGIHIFSRYTEERNLGYDVKTALNITIHKTGRTLATTAVTTSCAFFSLMLADFKGFFEFGFIAGTGILLSFLAMTLVAPAFIIIFEKPGKKKSKNRFKKINRHHNWKLPFSRTILFFGAGFALVAVFLLPRIKFEYDFSHLRSNLPQSQAVKDKLTPIIKESNSPAVVLVDTKSDLLELEKVIHEKMENDSTPTIDKFKSIYTMLPDRQEEKLVLIDEIKKLLGKDLFSQLSQDEQGKAEKLLSYTHVDKVTIFDLPESIQRLFKGKDGTLGDFAYIYPKVRLADSRNAFNFAHDVRNLHISSGKTFNAVNSSIIFADMLTMMLREGKKAIVITFLAVFFLVLLDIKNLFKTLLVLTPLIIGILWLVALMFLFKIKINFFNMIIFPTIIGIGIDNGVHLYHRYSQEGPGSIFKVLRNTGAAVSMSSLTTMVGFSGLIFAYHPGLNDIGELALMGILSTLIAALFILPALLQLLEKRTAKTPQKQP